MDAGFEAKVTFMQEQISYPASWIYDRWHDIKLDFRSSLNVSRLKLKNLRESGNFKCMETPKAIDRDPLEEVCYIVYWNPDMLLTKWNMVLQSKC